MTKTKLGALLLSVASVCAIATTSIGTARFGAVAEENTVGVTETQMTDENKVTSTAEQTYDQIEIAALEKYYSEQIASDEMMGAVFAGSVQNGWKGQTINPAFDDVTISYDYTRLTYNTDSNVPFGFRIALGDKCMVIWRWTERISMVRIDGGNEPLNVKVYVDDYYKNAAKTVSGVNGAAANVLGTKDVNGNATDEVYVNTGEYYNLPVQAYINDDGTSILNDQSLFNVVHGSATFSVSDPWTISFRKITKEDGTVVFRYYENGNYVLELQFEDEVTGYAPNSYNYSQATNKFDNFQVKLGDKYTEADAAQDKLTGSRSTQLDVGEEFDATFKNIWGGAANYAGWWGFTFTFGDSHVGKGILLARFTTRIALKVKDQAVRSEKDTASQNVYVRAQLSGNAFTNNAVNTVNGGEEKNFANNYGVTDMKVTNYTVDYRIVRLPNETIDDQLFQFYSLYETQVGQSERYVGDVGIPVENEEQEITITATPTIRSGVPVIIKNLTTTKLDNLFEGKEPAETTADFDETYAETLDGASVRFTLGSTGLRFTATVSEELIEAMKGYYTDVTFGVKLVRADGAFAYIEAKNYTLANGVYTFNGVVANIKAENYDKDYTPYAYVRYVDAEGATQILETLAGEAANIKAVAQAVLADVTNAKDETHIYAVSIDGTTVYSAYTQAQIDAAKVFAQA